jgi:dimethylargininase
MFTRAIVRPPGRNFADGLTTVDFGTPDYEITLRQHNAYCEALRSLGLTLTALPVDEQFPDSTFVEDTAILTERLAVITRPGALSRQGEIDSIKTVLARSFGEVRFIEAPGTVDGGDVCEAGGHFFIGISERTNEAGAEQLAAILAAFEYTSSFVDIRQIKSILHLKSGLSYVGEGQLVVIDELAEMDQFSGYELIRVDAGDEYAANCVLINDSVLVAAGYPSFSARLKNFGHRTIEIEMSEFQKMDGGLSCLSLRF